jgi:hypothetical protein
LNISIELFGQLAENQERKQTLDFTPGLTVHEAAASLGLNSEEIGLITINGVQSEMEDALKAGCRLCFFSYVTGG